jgi:prophage regulatory protein
MAQRVQRAAGVARSLAVAESTIWRWVASGKFPKPIKLGERVTVWDMDEIDEFIAEQRAATAENSHTK